MRYLPNSDADRAEMLQATGHESIEELFAQIPKELRLDGRLNLPGPLSEPEVLEFFRQAANETSRDYVSLLGAGAYSHYRPVVIDVLLSRGEFLTSYTPYQAEISQGNLQAMFEFQTLITQLTGMEVANSSLYDGSTATNEAVLMALRLTRRTRVVWARTLHPEYRQVVQTYVQHQGVHLDEVPYAPSGQIDLEKLDSLVGNDVAAVVVQSPNFFGALERTREIAGIAHRAGALLHRGRCRAAFPRNCQATGRSGYRLWRGTIVRSIRSLWRPLRRIPGDAGAIHPADARTACRPDRRQPRTAASSLPWPRASNTSVARATSNICTSQSLLALNAAIYLCLLGKTGLRRLADHNLAKAHYAARKLGAMPATELVFEAPFFNEFVVKLPGDVEDLLETLRKHKIIGGLNLDRFYPELKNHLLVCVQRRWASPPSTA